MASSRGPAVLRCVLPLAVMACCVLWTLLVLAPLPPELAAGHSRGSIQASVVGMTERWARDASPARRNGEIADMPPVAEREQIIDASRSPPPPPPENDAMKEPPPSLNRELIIIEASPPPEPQQRTEPPPLAQQPARQWRQKTSSEKNLTTTSSDRCTGRYIHIAALPPRFNADLLRNCRILSSWTDMCKHVSNAGMGPRLTRTGGGALPSTGGWYDTNQFTLEVIFHHRMLRYTCLTSDVSAAAAVYVPYYAGLDVGRHLWGPYTNANRDALAEDVVRWLRASPAWRKHSGRDHFLVAGRIAWDFMRQEGEEWGSRLLMLPEARNMTALVLESGGGHGGVVGVPYPTYFHPSRAGEVAAWQRAVRRARRPWLFAFAGAPRHAGGATTTLRDAVIEQCARSPRRCGLLQCGGAHGHHRRGRRDNDCHVPGSVMRLFKRASFCLQPPGDSYTRRSTFDAILAGCVPVFFHRGSAHAQYTWHLPADHSTYSVFVPGEAVRNGSVSVEDVLRRFSRAEVAAMRERVVRLIPRVVYRDPTRAGGEGAGFRDAVDVAVDGVIERVRRIDRGLPPGEEDEGAHRWDA